VSSVAILGAGAGGAAAAVELTHAGHQVRLWNRTWATLEPFADAGGVAYEGVLGRGFAEIGVEARLDRAVAGVDVAVVCLPALAHQPLADELAAVTDLPPLVLNPGHTGGALHLAARLKGAGVAPPPLAELSTLTYVARKSAPGRVWVTGRAGRVRGACLPGGDEALGLAQTLFPSVRPESDVLATGLANVNLVLHPPGAVLSAAWVEATGGDFRFYSEGTTPAVARTIEALDGERLAVARAFGHDLDPLLEEMAAIGTVEPADAARGDLGAAIAGGSANREIRAPDSLAHRYYTEDFGYGLLPLVELAELASVEVPLARSLLHVANVFCGGGLVDAGLTLARLGLEAPTLDELFAATRVGAQRAS
jgi:opine dehydrogenase